MIYVGLGLQTLGIALILIGGLKAAQEIGAVEKWWSGAKRWTRNRSQAVRASVVRVLLRRPKKQSVSAELALEWDVARDAVLSATEPDWESMDHDEQLALLRRRQDALRDLVDRNDEHASQRLDGVEVRLTAFEVSVDERFGGHDARDQTILGYELAGGAISLLGTVIVLLP